ncbi:UNVERIFIED_CONTAM: hypothetical protein Cloal_1811 [Acetivibrio alkalicellulosi]
MKGKEPQKDVSEFKIDEKENAIENCPAGRIPISSKKKTTIMLQSLILKNVRNL